MERANTYHQRLFPVDERCGRESRDGGAIRHPWQASSLKVFTDRSVAKEVRSTSTHFRCSVLVFSEEERTILGHNSAFSCTRQ